VRDFDAVVVGGGLIGAACADALAGEGRSVCLLDAGPFVREASWAGAGLLHPIHPWNYGEALHPLLRMAPALHQECARDLLDRTGIDVELERSGILVMGGELDRLAEWCGDSIPHERVDAARDEPAIRISGDALLIPEACHVRNQRLNRAFLEGARRRGATLLERTPVTSLEERGVRTAEGMVRADLTVLAAGAWAARLLPELSVEPVRGQILLYRAEPGHPRRVLIFPEGEYAVPRRDGLVLFGSTLEKAGFDARPRPSAVERLQEGALALLGLGPERLVAAWAGLRPGTASGLPYLGWHPRRPGLMLACGHYRNGILLAPLTGRIVADLASGRESGVDLAPFRPN